MGTAGEGTGHGESESGSTFGEDGRTVPNGEVSAVSSFSAGRIYSVRMSRTLQVILALVLAGVLVGCSSAKKYTFDLSVKNTTNRPITVWLTKVGPPTEREWLSPEQLAAVLPGHDERISGVVVPAGKTAQRGPVTGKFEEGSYAWLRVYDGQYKSLSDLLSVSRLSPKRVDMPLEAGKNDLVARDVNGRLVVEPDK